MKKAILLLLLGSATFVYGQNVDSTEKVRKWIFKSKTDDIKPRVDTLFLFKNNKPFEETFFGRNKFSFYSDFVINVNPLGDQKLYGGSPFLKVGFIQNKKFYAGIGYGLSIKEKYTETDISMFPTRIASSSLGLEFGYHILPEKIIHFSPFVGLNHNWIRFDKGFYTDLYLDDEMYVQKDKYWNLRLGTDVFVNITEGIRLGLNVNYNTPLNSVISESFTRKISGIGYGFKLQFHTSFTNKK
jgi:hypothetical protein